MMISKLLNIDGTCNGSFFRGKLKDRATSAYSGWDPQHNSERYSNKFHRFACLEAFTISELEN